MKRQKFKKLQYKEGALHPDLDRGVSSWHILDYAPNHPEHEGYIWGWENHLEDSAFLKEYARKMAFVALALVAEYGAVITLSHPAGFFKKKNRPEENQDLAELAYADLAKLIYRIKVRRQAALAIEFPTENVTMSLEDGFGVVLHGNLSGQFLADLRLLAERNGAYLKRYDDNGQRIYLYQGSGEPVLIWWGERAGVFAAVLTGVPAGVAVLTGAPAGVAVLTGAPADAEEPAANPRENNSETTRDEMSENNSADSKAAAPGAAQRAGAEGVPGAWHFLDIVPFQSVRPSLRRWEQSLENGPYIKDFARRLGFVVLTLVNEFGAEFHFSDPQAVSQGADLPAPEDVAAELPAAQLSKLVRRVIVKRCSELTLVFPSEGVEIRLAGGLDVRIVGARGDFLTFLRILAERNGLFLKGAENHGKKVYLYDESGERVPLELRTYDESRWAASRGEIFEERQRGSDVPFAGKLGASAR